MICPTCAGEMKSGKTNVPFELDGDKLIVVKDVPALVCLQCGDTFIEAPVLGVVEKLVDSAEKDGLVLGFVLYQEAA